jgi:hypothetical protein
MTAGAEAIGWYEQRLAFEAFRHTPDHPMFAEHPEVANHPEVLAAQK